ncbi:hypothetical protein BDN67DRAFT_968687 [Paxillus ammoniavirescens]|nr:hypothetical protein BDN67DRAFT_968687 [Paxillus ammoniavirescens]
MCTKSVVTGRRHDVIKPNHTGNLNYTRLFHALPGVSFVARRYMEACRCAFF